MRNCIGYLLCGCFLLLPIACVGCGSGEPPVLPKAASGENPALKIEGRSVSGGAAGSGAEVGKN